jgi:hypothetical protein
VFNRLRARLIAGRLEEEAAYAIVSREIESGIRRDGLWAKALASSRNEEEARGRYLKLRVKALQDEHNMQAIIADEEAAAQGHFDKRVIAGLDAEKKARDEAAEVQRETDERERERAKEIRLAQEAEDDRQLFLSRPLWYRTAIRLAQTLFSWGACAVAFWIGQEDGPIGTLAILLFLGGGFGVVIYTPRFLVNLFLLIVEGAYKISIIFWPDARTKREQDRKELIRKAMRSSTAIPPKDVVHRPKDVAQGKRVWNDPRNRKS